MLMITSFTNPRVAQAFVDYMATQGVILTIQHSVHFDIWLADDSREAVVRDELQRFLSNPGDGRYLAASWQSGQTHSGLRYRRFPFWSTLRNNGQTADIYNNERHLLNLTQYIYNKPAWENYKKFKNNMEI